MGKGSCKSTATKENEPIRITKLHTKDSDSKYGTRKSYNDHNKNLIEYVEAILSDPLNQSLTKEHITMKMAHELVNIRTADDVGLGHCIVVNVYNPLRKFPYATSPDCYCVFCDFFGPLIDDFHGFAQEQAEFEPRYGNVDRYSMVDLNTVQRSRVIYTDIVVRRNIGGHPFTPMISDSGRKDIISKLEGNFKKIFEKETESKVIPSEWSRRLDQLKPELEEIGAMKGYPNGRLHMFYDSDNDVQQGIILNFDDHLQIITSCNDGRLGQLYYTMYGICSSEHLDNIDFIVHPTYGYLTLSPAYIGTGFTIRVLARLPFLSRMVDIDSTILRYHDVTVNTGTRPCKSTGQVTISNKLTFNKTEEEILNDVIDAFKILCEYEEELEYMSPMAIQNDVMPVESFGRLYEMISSTDSRSYTKKYLSANVASQYDKVKTLFNNSLNNCIRANAYFPDSLYPRAADGDCYTKFRQFFTPIIYEINKINSTSHPNKPDYGSASNSALFMLSHRDIKSFRVRFSRNFEDYPYPMAMSELQRADVERMLIGVFDEFPVEIEGDYCSLEDLADSAFFDDILRYNLMPNFNKVEVCAGCYRDWPHQRGIFFIKTDVHYPELLTMIFINITDHIKVICLDPTGKNFHACYDRAVKIIRFLDLRFDKLFSRKPGYGFLTSLPQSVGCGLRISAKVYLKNLGDKREVLENICKTNHLVYRGSLGAGSPAIGNIFDVSLKLNMNVTEKWLCLAFCQNLKDLLLTEASYDPRIPVPRNDIFTLDSISESEEEIERITESDFSDRRGTTQGNQKENIESLVIENLEENKFVVNKTKIKS